MAESRRSVASLIGADAREIIFTSGATEANNLALLGVASAARRAKKSGHFVSSRVERKSVLDALKQLEKEGFTLTLLEPDENGRVPPEAVASALRPDTLLVSLMLANNEIGVINDIAGVARITRARRVLLHTDAAQAVGKIPVDIASLDVDFLSFTAHKLYGPKGVGALYVRETARPRIAPIQFGGGHERGLRSGTLPTHQLVGFGIAASLAAEQARATMRICAISARVCAANWNPSRVWNSTAPASRACRASSMRPSVAWKANRWSPGSTALPCPPARPAARPRESPATCCARWDGARSLRKARCDCPWAVSPRPPRWMPPPPPCATRSLACGRSRARTPGLRPTGSRSRRRAACWPAR